ncbi:MAG: 30S ribosomal protein S2 [Candidatus Babeliales bacterium]
MIDFRQLVKVGIHFGHQTSRWCPKMAPYIWGFKNKVHLIDVSKTAFQLEKASQFLEKIAAKKEQILWVGTKKSARDTIFKVAAKLNMPYVNHRWIGGTLSNYSQVRKSVTKLLHYEDVVAKAEKFPHYTKKELNTFQKIINRLKKSIGGIVDLKWPVGAVVIVDVEKEQSAVREAAVMGVPIVAIVDTNGDPSLVDYVIPANDDAPQAIEFIMDYLAKAVSKGEEIAQEESKKQQKEKEEQKMKQDKKETIAEKKEMPPKKNIESMQKKIVKKKPESSPPQSEETDKNKTKKEKISLTAKTIKSSSAVITRENHEKTAKKKH